MDAYLIGNFDLNAHAGYGVNDLDGSSNFYRMLCRMGGGVPYLRLSVHEDVKVHDVSDLSGVGYCLFLPRVDIALINNGKIALVPANGESKDEGSIFILDKGCDARTVEVGELEDNSYDIFCEEAYKVVYASESVMMVVVPRSSIIRHNTLDEEGRKLRAFYMHCPDGLAMGYISGYCDIHFGALVRRLESFPSLSGCGVDRGVAPLLLKSGKGGWQRLE